jgi:hypothetical protein
MRVSNIRDRNKAMPTLLVSLCCGCTGILIDFDHVISYILFPAATDRRIFHPAVFVISGIVLCTLITYCGGLYISSILRSKQDHEAEGAFKKRVYCNTDCAVKGSRQLKHWRDYYLPIRTDEIT